jgi:hypothetical protein
MPRAHAHAIAIQDGREVVWMDLVDDEGHDAAAA